MKRFGDYDNVPVDWVSGYKNNATRLISLVALFLTGVIQLTILIAA
ncbi:hypothetical protein [Paenibacillus pinisoli]|nr:hypothetical protein [Paenibacillus pinisoli]